MQALFNTAFVKFRRDLARFATKKLKTG